MPWKTNPFSSQMDAAIAVTFVVCISYTAIGGLKAVIWTNVFQVMTKQANKETKGIYGKYKIGILFPGVLHVALLAGCGDCWGICRGRIGRGLQG